MSGQANGKQTPLVDFPQRGIITTKEPIRTPDGEFTAFFGSTWIRMVNSAGQVDSWAVTQAQKGKTLVVLMIPIYLINGFIASNHAGGSDVYDADGITLIEIA